MSIVVRFTPSSPPTTEQYDGVVRTLEEQGDFPPDGLDVHVAFDADGNFRVDEIWDSREQFDKFGERLMPVLSDAGIDPGEPEVFEVYNIVRR
jgi:hypothetical protein